MPHFMMDNLQVCRIRKFFINACTSTFVAYAIQTVAKTVIAAMFLAVVDPLYKSLPYFSLKDD